jgi:hypothetical protein
METYARNAKGTSLRIVSIDPPFSNFDFYEDSTFPVGFQKPETFRRICSQVRRLGGRTMVIEELENSRDITDENRDLRKLHPKLYPAITRRISFFKKHFKTTRAFHSLNNTSALGYVIFKEEYLSPTPPVIFSSRIWESVIIHPQRENNYVRGMKQWAYRVADRSFTITGCLYAQQNGETNCCAHVALRSVAANFHKDGDMTYSEMNKILGIDHTNTFAWNGLSLSQQLKVLTTAGANCISANFALKRQGRSTKRFQVPPFQKYVYGSIESGYPSIITFKTKRSAHAIPVFGHTFNQDTWVPLAEGSYFSTGGETRYIPSDAWLSMFIGHDDNFGSNVCVPSHYLQRMALSRNQKKLHPKQVAYVISTIPKTVKVEPIFAELIGAHYLWHITRSLPSDNAWNRRLKASVKDPKNPKNNRVVLRTRLVQGGEYCDHLASLRGWNGSDAIPENLIGPIRSYIGHDWVWIVEFSMLEIFAGNLRKLGEIAVRADKELSFKKTDLEGFLLARVPSFFVTIENKNGKMTLIPSGISNHVRLLDC